jgi:hypothetical protein
VGVSEEEEEEKEEEEGSPFLGPKEREKGRVEWEGAGRDWRVEVDMEGAPSARKESLIKDDTERNDLEARVVVRLDAIALGFDTQ